MARQRDYVRRTFYLNDFSKEMRLTEMWKVMYRRMHTSVAEMKEIVNKYGYKMMFFRYLFENQSILKNAENKTVIFISHRLSTTRMADRIYMFFDGEIIESGSHEELMMQNGKYAEMYRVQAKKYRNAGVAACE